MELMPGYKQTEVGLIPEDWKLEHLGAISHIDVGLSKPKIVFGSGCPVVTVQDLYAGSIIEVSGLKRVVISEEEIQKYKLAKDDILIGNASVKRDGIGYANRFNGAPEDVIFAKYAYRARALSSVIPIFLHHVLRAPFCRNWIISKSQTGTLTNLNKAAAKGVPIPLPKSIVEQEAIAKALSDADALIESLDQLIAKKRQIKQGAMQELLTGKRRLPGFGGEWAVKCLNELAVIDPEQLSSNTQPEYEFKYISLEDVDFGALRGYSLQVFRYAPSRARRKLRVDDLLVSTVRPNLKSHLWFRDRSENWVCSTGFSVVRCLESVSHPGYVFAHLFADGIAKQIDALLTGSNYPAINSRDVRQLQVPVPSLEEQTAIATILSDMDTELAALESRLAKARQIKQGMMQELLTGRIRLL